MVKPLGPLLASLEGYLGASILGDGRIALLVEPAMLTREVSCRPALTGPSARRDPDGRAEAPKVLVVEDSFTVRELQRSILEAAGYSVVTARDGRDALAVLDRDAAIVARHHRPRDARAGRDRAHPGDPRRTPRARRCRSSSSPRGPPRKTGSAGSRRARTPTWPSGASISRLCSRPSNASSAGDEVTPLRVLICEDSATFASALRRTLEFDADITVVAVCSTAEEAISALPRTAPDLVTMDVALPGMGGIDAVGTDHGLPAAADPRAVRPGRPGNRPAGGGAGRRGARRARQGRPRPARPGRPFGGRTPAPDKGAQPRTRDPPSERPARRPLRRASSGPPRLRDRHLRVSWRSPGADAPARRAARRLPDPDPGRAAHRRRFHRRPGPLAGPDRRRARRHRRGRRGGRRRGLVRAGGRAPHAGCLRAAGPRPAHRCGTLPPVR